jgi:hypothetical protein
MDGDGYLLLLVKVTDTDPVGPLGIYSSKKEKTSLKGEYPWLLCWSHSMNAKQSSVKKRKHTSVNVHLDDTVADSGLDVVLGGAGTTVEDEPDGLVRLGLALLLDVGLVLAEKLGVELDVAGSIDTVDVTESSGDREEVGDLGEGIVDVENVLGLGVERSVVDLGVVNTILLASGDTDLHLEVAVDLGHALKVLDTNLDVLLLGVLREIEHVGREEGLAVLGEVLLISGEHTVEPGEELLGAVVRVDDDGDTVGLGDGTDVVGTGNSSEDGSSLVLVGDSLSGVVGSTTVRELDDNGRLGITGSLC